MSSSMFPEITEIATSSRRGRKKTRKIWRKPIRVPRLPSLRFSGSDFTFDQIPAIFSGYTAGSESSSSSEISDASRSYSQSASSADENEEINHVRSRVVWRRANSRSISGIPSMKLRRQLTKKLSGGGTLTVRKLKKIRSVKRSSSRNLGSMDNQSSYGLSGEAFELSQPHYLKPTSSSASKKVVKNPNAHNVSDGKVCTYMYCSLHGHHTHEDDVNVPSLKRFVSMRRRILKRQKSKTQRSGLLKPSLSRKRGLGTGRMLSGGDNADREPDKVGVIANRESMQEVCEEHAENYSKDDDSHDSPSVKEKLSASGEESKPEIMDLSSRGVDKNVKLWRLLHKQMVRGLSRETVGHCEDSVENLKEGKEEDNSNRSDAVKLVKEALDEILTEIPDSSSAMEDQTSEHEHVKGEDENAHVSEIGSASEPRGSKNWSYLKKVILLNRFRKLLENVRDIGEREMRDQSVECEKGEESGTKGLRQSLVGERKNVEEWMLDYALQKVISSLDPLKRKKVEILVRAFETVVPVDSNPNSVIEKKVNQEDGDETEATAMSGCLNSEEVVGSLGNESLCEERLDGLDSIREDEKKGDFEKSEIEKQNLIRWRNVMYNHLMKDRMPMEENAEVSEKLDHTEEIIEEDGDEADSRSHAVDLVQQALEKMLSEIPDRSSDEEVVSASFSNSSREERGYSLDQPAAKNWNHLKKTVVLQKFVRILERVPRKLRNLPVESELGVEKVVLRHRYTDNGNKVEESMLDYAIRQGISKLAPFQRRKVALLVHAFDAVLDGHGNVMPFQDDHIDERGLKEEDDECPVVKESKGLRGSVMNDESKIAKVEKEKDSRVWNLIYKHMVTGGENHDHGYYEEGESGVSVEDNCHKEFGLKMGHGSSGVVTLVRDTLEKILSEIPDNASDDQSINSADQELFERNISEIRDENGEIALRRRSEPHKSNQKQPSRWNNLKKIILLRRFVKELGNLPKLHLRAPRTLPLESDSEAEKINLRHQPLEGRKSSEEWMLDYALQKAISTLAPSQKRKVALLSQAFDTISLQDIGICSSPSDASSLVQSENDACSEAGEERHSIKARDSAGSSEEQAKREIGYKKEENFSDEKIEKEDLVVPRDGQWDDVGKQQCSSLWRLLCKKMEEGVEDSESDQTSLDETNREEEFGNEAEMENDKTEGERKEAYETEAVKLLEEVIDGISLPEGSDKKLLEETSDSKARQKTETEQMPSRACKGWKNLKRVILLKRFVTTLEKMRKFEPRKPEILPSNPELESENVNLRHQETRMKKNGEEWMVDRALQDVVAKLTPARKKKVQLLVQAFDTVSSSGN